jgi:hypothetical protein
MKRVLGLVLAALLVLSLFAACVKKEEEKPVGDETVAETAELKTFNDVFTLDGAEFFGSSGGSGVFIYVYLYQDAYWRAIGKVPQETLDAYNNVDIMAPDHEQKEREIMGPVEISILENLNDQILTDAQQEALIGKTGADLVRDGWKTDSGYNLEDMDFYMSYGPFEYIVTFEAQEPLEITDDFDEIAAISPLKVLSITFFGISDASADITEDIMAKLK